MRLAFFTPLTPLPSGISDYGEALLRHLAPLAGQIDVFIDDYTPAAQLGFANLKIRPWREFEPDHVRRPYDSVVYQMGNNPYHVYIYDLALRIPGILILHEFNLHYLLTDVTIRRDDWEGYLAEAYYNGGIAALEHAQRARRGLVQPDFNGLPMNRRLLERSQAAVVHSEYMAGLIRQTGIPIPVRRIPHGVEFPEVNRGAARAALAAKMGWNLREDDPIIGVFGFLKPYKSIHQTLRAVAAIRRQHPRVKLVLAGEEHPHYPLRPLIDELHLSEAVGLPGFQSHGEFLATMSAVDITVNLRWPTAGETSGSLLWSLALGKPTLVSEVGSFEEFPEGTTVRVPVGTDEERWITGWLHALLEDPALAGRIGAAGQDYVRQSCAWPAVANQHIQFLAEMNASQDQRQPGEARVLLPLTGRSPWKQCDGSKLPPAQQLADYIMDYCQKSPEMAEYAKSHLARLVQTIQVTPPGSADERILEMGCYMQITPALRTLLDYGEVRGAYFGRLGESGVRTVASITGEEFSCQVDLFDAEKDVYPYPDGYFHTVLCCELLEHLHYDPMHMMSEISRILAPGGCLILSTPNITSWRSVQAVLHGYHPGLFAHYIRPAQDGTIDPRHAREYAPRELGLLMECAGLAVEAIETGYYTLQNPEMETARQIIAQHGLSAEYRGDVLYARGRKVGPVVNRWPKELYYP